MGNPVVVGDYTYPGEEEGRFLLLSSTTLLGWLGARQDEGLRTISRINIDATFKVPPPPQHNHHNHHNHQTLSAQGSWLGSPVQSVTGRS